MASHLLRAVGYVPNREGGCPILCGGQDDNARSKAQFAQVLDSSICLIARGSGARYAAHLLAPRLPAPSGGPQPAALLFNNPTTSALTRGAFLSTLSTHHTHAHAHVQPNTRLLTHPPSLSYHPQPGPGARARDCAFAAPKTSRTTTTRG